MKYFALTFFMTLYFFTVNINIFGQQTRSGNMGGSLAYITLARNMKVSNARNALNRNLYINDILYESSMVKTMGRNSYGAILLDSSTAFRLFENTSVFIENSYDNSGRWVLRLDSGCMVVAANSNIPTTIKTVNTSIQSMGAVFSVCFDGQNTTVSVLSGTVSVNGVNVGDFYSFDTTTSSLNQFMLNDAILFNNVDNIPGIDTISNLGNLYGNIVALKRNRIGEIITAYPPTTQDNILDYGNTTDNSSSFLPNENIDNSSSYGDDYIEKEMRF